MDHAASSVLWSMLCTVCVKCPSFIRKGQDDEYTDQASVRFPGKGERGISGKKLFLRIKSGTPTLLFEAACLSNKNGVDNITNL
jgi:hypothetical protein